MQTLASSTSYWIEADLKGVVDLVKMKAIIWHKSLGAKFEELRIPENLKEKAEKYRKELVEAAVEQDEKLMELILEGKDIFRR